MSGVEYRRLLDILLIVVYLREAAAKFGYVILSKNF